MQRFENIKTILITWSIHYKKNELDRQYNILCTICSFKMNLNHTLVSSQHIFPMRNLVFNKHVQTTYYFDELFSHV